MPNAGHWPYNKGAPSMLTIVVSSVNTIHAWSRYERRRCAKKGARKYTQHKVSGRDIRQGRGLSNASPFLSH